MLAITIIMQPPLSVEVLVAMDKCYGFNKSENAEIKFRYSVCAMQ